MPLKVSGSLYAAEGNQQQSTEQSGLAQPEGGRARSSLHERGGHQGKERHRGDEQLRSGRPEIRHHEIHHQFLDAFRLDRSQLADRNVFEQMLNTGVH